MSSCNPTTNFLEWWHKEAAPLTNDDERAVRSFSFGVAVSIIGTRCPEELQTLRDIMAEEIARLKGRAA